MLSGYMAIGAFSDWVSIYFFRAEFSSFPGVWLFGAVLSFDLLKINRGAMMIDFKTRLYCRAACSLICLMDSAGVADFYMVRLFDYIADNE